jgi:glycosyltransferase involved in cell wall biosynthesis
MFGALLRLVSRGEAILKDRRGRVRRLGRSLPSAGARMAVDVLRAPIARRQVEAALRELEELTEARHRNVATAMPRTGPALMIRTDLWLGIKAGGSVAHTAGIANAFAEAGMLPALAAYERNPILLPSVRTIDLALPARHWNQPNFAPLAANLEALSALECAVRDVGPSLVYNRLAACSFAPALTARRARLPLIVEYNGSEVWIARNWGKPMREETMASRIETAVLTAADRIVAVSTPLADELEARGIPRSRIVVAANGVDTTRFHPDLAADVARQTLGIPSSAKVVGFIGTFGAWHGAPVLIKAWANLLAASSSDEPLRLLLIGDGPERSLVEALIAQHCPEGSVLTTGLIPQADAPKLLATCDILVSPHVPNADGSRFFGSPTKLFEYMAMGRPIVASRLGQIGDMLQDRSTALLVPPGDAQALSHALAELIADNGLAHRLGCAARQEAVRKHAWGRRLEAILG